MKAKTLPLAAPLLGASLSAQSQTVEFGDASGLRAEAEFVLLDMGSTLEIRVRNLSTGGPTGFDSADQILTWISIDLGGLPRKGRPPSSFDGDRRLRGNPARGRGSTRLGLGSGVVFCIPGCGARQRPGPRACAPRSFLPVPVPRPNRLPRDGLAQIP